MHQRRASEIFFDEGYRLPELLVPGGQLPRCPLTPVSGGRTVASLATRHLAAALEARCVAALARCLDAGEVGVEPVRIRLGRTDATPAGALRLVGRLESLGDATAHFACEASDARGRRIALAVELRMVPRAGMAAARRATPLREAALAA